MIEFKKLTQYNLLLFIPMIKLFTSYYSSGEFCITYLSLLSFYPDIHLMTFQDVSNLHLHVSNLSVSSWYDGQHEKHGQTDPLRKQESCRSHDQSAKNFSLQFPDITNQICLNITAKFQPGYRTVKGSTVFTMVETSTMTTD